MPMVGGVRPRLSSETEKGAQEEQAYEAMQQVVCNMLAWHVLQNQVRTESVQDADDGQLFDVEMEEEEVIANRFEMIDFETE